MKGQGEKMGSTSQGERLQEETTSAPPGSQTSRLQAAMLCRAPEAN